MKEALLSLSFVVSGARSPLVDNVGLGFSEEFSQTSPLNLFIFELLHDLVSEIIGLRREHLGLIFLTVELLHNL